jgi:hypothetical protein
MPDPDEDNSDGEAQNDINTLGGGVDDAEIDEGELPEAGEANEEPDESLDDAPPEAGEASEEPKVEKKVSALSSLAALTRDYCDYKRKDWAPSTMMVTDGAGDRRSRSRERGGRSRSRDRDRNREMDRDRDQGRGRDREERGRDREERGRDREERGREERGRDRGGRERDADAGEEEKTSLLVRNLGFDVNAEDLKQDFEKFG